MASTGEINLSEDRRPSRKGGGEARNRRPESRAGQHRAQPGRPAPRGAPASRQGGKASQGRPRTPPEPGKGARQPTAPTRSRQPAGPEIPAHISADQLDPSRRAELRTLPRDLAERVARHLAAAEQTTDAELAYQHAVAARRLAARVGAVREFCGIAAYLAGRWAEALSELRTARRLTGRAGYLAMMADCERALGRYDRALALLSGPEATAADRAEQIELRIVESGIRRDMGAAEAAVVVLQVPELTEPRLRPWSARLFYAYADALVEVSRTDEAREWFARAAAADPEEETGAAQRFEELDDVTIEDLADEPGEVDEATSRPLTG